MIDANKTYIILFIFALIGAIGVVILIFANKPSANFTGAYNYNQSEILIEDNEFYGTNQEISDFYNIYLDKSTCKPITCECAINTSTPCMAYCFRCEKLEENK